ncbi:cytoskeleton-associated protein 5-like [Tubulanus polymorphus]|uniref:cytoskeleton-associated protein 5-like n=1 Tax=Tubulanus polymorphus TaxID=672921 RepID=UPI003DA44A49
MAAPDDNEWLKLPTNEKIQHKAWKARIAGYEEAIKLFKSITDEKNPEFSKYLGLIKKMVVDSNAIAQEKGLEAVATFVENAACAGKTAGEGCSGIVAKCLNSARAKTKEKALEILMLYVEIEKQDIVQEELIKGFSNKTPKIVSGSVLAMREAMRDFGTKIIPVKPLVKLLPGLLEHRDKIVREEGKALVIEIYRWVGAAIKPQLVNLKPVQLTELEAEFEKLPSEKPIQTRFLRSQQDLKEKLEAQAAAREAGDDVDGEEEQEEEDIDPYELMTPVEILSKLPKDYYDKIEAKKWQERKEVLEAVQKLAENPKLEPGDYGDLVRSLKKVVGKDSNVMLVALAAKILTSLANGLKKKFAPYATVCIETILEKFKEKKLMVVQALRDASDAIFLSTTIESFSEECVAQLENKNPSIKAETALFIARCFTRCTPATLPKKLLKIFCVSLLKTINDTAPDVREASFQALGTAMKVVGEKPLAPFLADVDNIKVGRIKECCDKAELVNMKGKIVSKPTSAAAAAAPSSAPAAAAKPAPKSAPSKSKPPTKGAVKPRPGGPPARATKSKKPAAAAPKDETIESLLSDEAVEEKASAVLPGDTLTRLKNANWKERLAAMETFMKTIQMLTKDEIPTQALIRTVAAKPGLKDNNFQVLKIKLEFVAFLASNSKFSKQSAEFVLSDLIDKIGDIKNGSGCKAALTAIAEAISIGYVCQEVIPVAFEQKNPKNQSETLNWVSQAIKEFGFKVNVKPMITYIKKAFGHTNPAVRTAAITLVGVIYMYMGAPIRVMFEEEKAALLQQIDAEIDKVKDSKPPAPIRGAKPKDVADGNDDEDDEEEEESNPADLIPRTDISSLITDEIVEQLADKNWKIRNEGLQKVTQVLSENKFITANIGPLPEALKVRLGDSNKLLVNTTLGICQTLATAMGPQLKKHIPVMGPAILNCLSDAKPNLRQSAVKTLDAWLEQSHMNCFIENEMLSEELRKENPMLRAELLGWLSSKLPNYKKLNADLKLCIPFILICLEDRNPEVRKKSNEALVPFMIHTGYESFIKATSKLKPSSKTQCSSLLEKARENLPAKEPKTAKPAAAPAAVAAPVKEPSPVKSDADDSEPEPTAKKVVGGKLKPPAGKTIKAGGAKSGKPSAAKTTGKKDAELEEECAPLINNKNKEQRIKDEKSRKVLKWDFTTPNLEYLDILQRQMDKNVSEALMEQMFHKDFKVHIKAIEQLAQVVDTDQAATIANLDLLLKWSSLRFFDTNPSMLMKLLEYLQSLFAMLAEKDYHLTEYEATSFIPYLVNKVGDPKDIIRRDVRSIFKLIYKVYPASKTFNYLIDGLKSKNNRQRSECLEELGILIDVYGINVCHPSPAQALKLIAAQISNRDNSVRTSALNTLVISFNILGDNLYKYLGALNDKDQGMLEERIKRSGKIKPPGGGGTGGGAAVEEVSAQKTTTVIKTSSERPNTIETTTNNQQQTRGVPSSALGKKNQYFKLDMDEMEISMIAEPQLVDYNIEEILEPVNIPEPKVRPPSPSMMLLGSSSDAASAIGFAITQIANVEISISMQALAQVDEVLKDSEKANMMTNHVDMLLSSISMQLRLAYIKHISDESTPKLSVIQLLKCLLATLMEIFTVRDLAKNASTDILKDLTYHLVKVLLDNRLNELDEGPQVVRSVNVLVVKMIEKSEPSRFLSSSIKLLHECVASDNCSPQFKELVMKCLWRVVRYLPNVINDLNFDRVLLDIHTFLRAFPPASWKDRGNDVPLRTVKTIVHSLTKFKGNKIMDHFSLIESHDSELQQYVQKILNSGVGGGNEQQTPTTHQLKNKNEQINGGGTDDQNIRTPDSKTTTTTKCKDSAKSKQRFSKSTHDMLAEIFKKIGCKENTREGLNDLFDFKLKYPEADLGPFLKKSSTFFQNYIERGLKTIEAERATSAKENERTEHDNNSAVNNTVNNHQTAAVTPDDDSGSDSVINPSVYMERLRVLRQRCGLDNQPSGDGGNLSKSSSDKSASSSVDVSVVLPNVAQQQRTTDSTEFSENNANNDNQPIRSNVDDLRKRLEMVKRASSKT